MKRVHLIGAGGCAGIGLTRCLKEHFDLTGEDDSPWARELMECKLASARRADMVIAVPDSRVFESSFRPGDEQIDLCQNKAKCAEVLGDLAPKTYWVRDTVGAGGAGAQMASEVLPGRNFSVEFVYCDGMLKGFFQKQRISYSVKEKTRGLDNRGSSVVSLCTFSEEVYEVAETALLRLSIQTKTKLNGFYGVDLVENEQGVPRVTEINAGRLLTASYSYYYLTGYNLPLIGVKAFFGEDIPPLPDYPVGFGLLRQTDCLPHLISPDDTKNWERGL